MSEESRSSHILELAKELLDDIELGRIDAEKLLLKTTRLARWVGSEEIQYWLRLELAGYNSTNELSLRYMGLTGRWIDRENLKGYWGPLAQHEATIQAQSAKMASLRVPDGSGDHARVAIITVTNAMTVCANSISTLSGIRSRVLARLHEFISSVYYEKEFDNLAESIFESFRTSVDSLIAEHCGDVLAKIPSVMDRLADADPESISQALTTCRRILEAFADSIFPPSDNTVVLGGNTIKLDAGKHQNRINAYVGARTQSQSRRQRIRQNLSNLFERVSTGVHSDVTAKEARALFLNTYLFLGEVLELPAVLGGEDHSSSL